MRRVNAFRGEGERKRGRKGGGRKREGEYGRYVPRLCSGRIKLVENFRVSLIFAELICRRCIVGHPRSARIFFTPSRAIIDGQLGFRVNTVWGWRMSVTLRSSQQDDNGIIRAAKFSIISSVDFQTFLKQFYILFHIRTLVPQIQIMDKCHVLLFLIIFLRSTLNSYLISSNLIN